MRNGQGSEEGKKNIGSNFFFCFSKNTKLFTLLFQLSALLLEIGRMGLVLRSTEGQSRGNRT